MRSLFLSVELALARGAGATLLAALVLLAVGAAAVVLITQQQREAAALVAALEAARTAAARAPGGGSPARPPDNAARLAAFENVLGARGQLDQHLRGLFGIARGYGLRLAVGEYRMAGDTAGGYQRYEVQLPVTGRFDAIQSFSHHVLRDLPFAALEELTFTRDTVGSAAVEARLRFVLFLADRAPGAAHGAVAEFVGPVERVSP
jgi:hypothetical protein